MSSQGSVLVSETTHHLPADRSERQQQAQPLQSSEQTTDSGQLQQAQNQWKSLLTGNARNVIIPHLHPTILTTTNLRSNNPWGDHRQQKDEGVTRIYSINLNGIRLDRRGGTFDELCKNIKEIQADIFCGQEHNLDTTQMVVRSVLYETAGKHWARHRMSLGTTPITFETQYKPGGTLILTVDSLTGRVIHQERDKWGRWTVQEFTGRGTKRLAVFSTYQPIDKGNHKGKITVAAQHTSLLRSSDDPAQTPRTAYRRDLFRAIKDYHDKGTELLVLGDFNEPLGSDPDGIVKIASAFNLLDIMTTRHSSQPPATYARGSKRLDYALGSSGVCDSLLAAGYDEFNALISSDHRGYFLDLDTDILFGSATQQLASMNRRGLQSNNPQQVTAYIRHKHKMLTDHNAFSRMDRLLLPGNHHTLAENLDRAVLEASLAAENKVRRKGEAIWSIALAHARKRVSLLTKYLSALKTGFACEHVKDELLKLDPSLHLPTNHAECSSALRDMKQQVKEIVSESYFHRDQERKRKIEMLEATRKSADLKTAQRLRRIKKAEDLKQLFQKLRTLRVKTKRKGVTRIEIPTHPNVDPKACTEWTQVDVPTDILRLLQERNQKHFGQANGSPFTVSPLSDDLGFVGDTSAGDDILSGRYHSSDLQGNVHLLVKHIQQVHDMASSGGTPTISESDFRGKLQVWAESTTTSPSGMHLGHYKSLIARHSFQSDLPDDELTEEFKTQRDELNAKQADLLDLHVRLLNYSVQRGYSYKRWQTIANTILFKDDDNVRLHRTRVIHIYEADYNLILGIGWRQAMYKAEMASALNDGQYGSRQHRNATDPVFIEEMQCEISRATRQTVIFTNHDAEACYDRIVPNLAMLVSRKYEVPKEITQLNGRTLEKAEYRIRTELGLAETGYSHSRETPILGTGQGSANSPAIWCFLSSTLFDVYASISNKAHYVNPSGDTAATMGMIGFVDDCNDQVNIEMKRSGESPCVHHALQQAQRNAQHWHDVLQVSGGALELSKCSCQVLHWQFNQHGAPYLAPKDPQHQDLLTVTDQRSAQTKTLALLSPYQAHKTLGHYKDPAGTQRTLFQKLHTKSDELTSFLWRTPLTRLESWTFYFACYLPSIGYSLGCSFLSRNQLDSIQRKALSIIIPRCGFNRNTKREIIYGPLELGGAAFRHLYIQQGIGQTELFLTHWRAKSKAGKLLRIAVHWFQRQVGTSTSFLVDVVSKLPHLESKWLASLRDFLASIKSRLVLDDSGIPDPQRTHDTFIMDGVLQSHLFLPVEIKRINYCRLYLQAYTISDLTDACGHSLDRSKLQGNPSLMSSVTMEPRIIQSRPSEEDWRLWRRANRLWSSEDGTLHQPLGDWQQTVHQQRMRHHAYRSRFHIWIRHGDTYLKCQSIHSASVSEFIEHRRVEWDDIPAEATPIRVSYATANRWRVEHFGSGIRTQRNQRPTTFQQYRQSLPDWEEELLHHVTLFEDPYSIGVSLSFGIRGVSDGSVWFKRLGSFGWILSNEHGERVAEGMGPAPGAHPNSYRSEAYGLLSMLCFLNRLAEYTGQHEPWQGILATDSLSLINTIQGKWFDDEYDEWDLQWIAARPLPELSPEWDLVSSIKQLMDQMPELRLRHVKGQQDRTLQYSNLSMLAQLNVEADSLANQYQRDYGAERTQVLLTQTAGAHLVTPNGTITSKYTTAIRRQATYTPLFQYIREKHGWSENLMKNINWAAHGTSLRKRIERRTHFIKLVHDILPTNHRKHRTDPLRRRCPSCDHGDEDFTHILRCGHHDRIQWREQLVTSLKVIGVKWRTDPELVRILVAGITEWFHWTETERYELCEDLYDDKYGSVIRYQNQVGWHQLFMGRFAVQWGEFQNAFYVTTMDEQDRTKKRLNGDRWQTAMIGAIWDKWYELWMIRNAALHGNDQSQRAQAERREALRKLRELYDLRNHYEPSMQILLMSDLMEHLAKPTWQIQNWLAMNEPVLRASYRKVRKHAMTGMRSIRQYFQPG